MRCFVINKRQIGLAVMALALAVVTVVGSTKAFAKENKKLPIYCVERQDKKIALTFDAAWGNDDTGTLIDILAKYNAKATFFVVGQWVDKYPESVKQLSDAGHQVQNHSDDHPYMSKLSAEQMLSQLERCSEKIAAITGDTPTLFRPPYGDYNTNVVTTVESFGMKTIQWDVDSLDWKDSSTAQSIAERVIGKVKPGSIVLFHNDAEYTPDALPVILENLSKQGYTFEFVSDLIYQDNYKIDHTGMQIPNSAVSSAEQK